MRSFVVVCCHVVSQRHERSGASWNISRPREDMYYCAICQQLANPGNPSYRIVVATRPAEYPYRVAAHRSPRKHHGTYGLRLLKRPKSLTPEAARLRRKELGARHEPTDDPGGHGCEVARELTVCSACATAWRISQPPQRAQFRPRRE
jgi:hypothetical protein